MGRPRRRIPLAATLGMSAIGLLGSLTWPAAIPVPTAAAALARCPLSALARTRGPVNITFWESMTRANAQTLQAITSSFNSSQSRIRVTLVAQASYDDTWQKYAAGLSNGQLPDIVQLEDVRTQEAIDTRSFLPVQSCINASHYNTSDFIPRVLAYWRVGGVQQAMPFAVSNPILYYNKLAFQKAGLNPASPPATLPQLLADARVLKAKGFGTGLKLDPWHLETWLATGNQLFVNNLNGRAARATQGVFNTPAALTIFSQLNQLVRGAGATTNPSSGPDAFDNLLGIGSGKYAMSIDTSAALGTISQVLNSGQYPNVRLGIGPFPVLGGSVRGGIEPGGSGVYLPARVPAVEQAAAWQYMQYLVSAQSQATWAAGTGYIPVRRSATATATVQHLWLTNPGYKVAYDQLNNGVVSPATAGSVIGPYDQVRQNLLDAEVAMYAGQLTPRAALRQALSQTNATMATYNQRLGVS